VVAVMRAWLNKLLSVSEKGQGLVEYALIVVLISIVSITIMGTVGGRINTIFTSANTALTPAGAPAAP
jgi:pilus assembly protein Flp/PilA